MPQPDRRFETSIFEGGAPGMGSMPFLGSQQALTFNNINRLALLEGRANPICGHPYGLPRKDPSSGSHGARNTVLRSFLWLFSSGKARRLRARCDTTSTGPFNLARE